MSSQTQTKGAVMANAKSKWPVKLPVHGDDGGVNSVAISKDGKIVVGCTYFYNKGAASVTKQVGVYVFDELGNQKFKDEFSATAPPGPGQGKRGVKTGVHFVALSRDGAWAASSGYIGTASPTPANPGFIKAYDIASGTVFPLLNTSDQAGMVAISKDGTYLAVASDKLYLFKRSGSGATATWSSQSLGFADILRSVAISNDGKWIVAGISGGQVALVQNNGGMLAAAPVYDMPVKSFPDRFWALGVAVSGKGNAFAVAGENATLYFFDIPATLPATLSEAWSETLPGTASCRSVALADDGSRVAAVASDGGVGMPAGNGLLFVFDKNHVAGSAKWSPPANTMHGPNCVSMDKAGDYVAAADGTPKTGGSGNFYLFDAAAGAAGWSNATNKMNYPIQIAADGAFAVGGCDDGHVYYFTVP